MPMIDGVKVSFEFAVVRESMLTNSASAVQFSCSPCIRGHRSAHCPDTHSDRPLVEVKSEFQIFFSKLFSPGKADSNAIQSGKGRPVSQCKTCRDARKTKALHGKCNCEGKAEREFCQLFLSLRDACC
jgi:hypothetical protein